MVAEERSEIKEEARTAEDKKVGTREEPIRRELTGPSTAQLVHEHRREFLEDLWGIATPESTMGRADFLQWAQQFSPEELFLHGEHRPAPEMPLTGSVQDATIQALLEIQRRKLDPVSLHEWLRGSVVATLRQWERSGQASPEQRVDLMLMALARELKPRCSSSLRRLLAGMRGHLLTQAPEARGEGFFRTWAGLGEFLGPAGEECVPQACFYYHEVLSELLQRRASEPALRTIVRGAANNLTSLLDDLAPPDQTVGALAGPPVLNRLHALAAVFEPARVREPTATVEAMSILLGAAFDQVYAQDYSPVLTTMMNVPAAWRTLHPQVRGDIPDWGEPTPWSRIAYMEACAGVLRAGMVGPEDYDDISSGFFNAGVSFARQGREAGGDEAARWMQTLCPAVGLWWAVHLASTVNEALTRLHGLQCAVNLFGGASDLAWDEPSRDSLAMLARVLRTYRTPTLENRFFQMSSAFRQLGIGEGEGEGEATAPLANLRTAASEAVQTIAAHRRLEWPRGVTSGPRDLGRIATFIRGAFQLYRGDDALEHNADLIARLLRKLADVRKSLESALPTYYGDLAGDPERGIPGRGPLVEAGILTGEQWSDLASKSIENPPSLADWVAQNLDWVLALPTPDP